LKKNSFTPIGLFAAIISFFWFRICAGHLITFQLDHEPVFLYTREYLLEHFLSFGGLSELFSRFLMQFYITPWLGAAALTLLIVSLLHRAYALSEGKTAITLLLGVLALAFITIVEGSLVVIVVLSLILKIINDQEKLAQSNKALWWYRMLALPLLIWIAGSWAWLYLIVVLLRDTIGNKKFSFFSIVFILYAGILAFIAYRFIWAMPLKTLLLGMFPFDSIIGVLLFSWAALVLLSSLMPRSENHKLSYPAYTVVLILFILITVLNLTNPMRVTERWRGYIKDGSYQQVIKEAERKAPKDRIQTLYLNFALAKERRLLDDMFSFPQSYGPEGLLPNPHRGVTTRNINEFWFIGHFYYETGYIDKAHRIAVDELVFNGVTPSYTKLMVKCLMAGGHPQAAKKYLTLLDHTLFHRKWAKRYQHMISDTKAYNKEFASVEHFLPRQKKVISYDPSRNLLSLLEQEVANPLAFNYLCAYNLLLKKPEFLVDNLWVLKELGYTKLPKHYQESLLIYQLGHPQENINLEGILKDQNTARKFIDFGAQFSKDKNPILANYSKQFKGMYVLYWFFTKFSGEAS
jgi:Family of unknown function (DUF6057)